MELLINGEKRAVNSAKNITDVVAELGLEPKMVLIEHNGTALRRSEWPNSPVKSGDQLEILRVSAGG
jgi:sulfur carrier protein